MFSRIFIILSFCLTLQSCNKFQGDWSDPTYSVSMVELIVEPEKYEGENVLVYGYFDAFPLTKLYLSENHALGYDFASSIDIGDDTDGGEISNSPCESHYVVIRGRIYRDPNIRTYMIYPVKEIRFNEGKKVCWSSDG